MSKNTFFSIGSKLSISQEKLEEFWKNIETSEQESSTFSKYLFYFGALIVILAMTWFMSIGWNLFGGGGIFLISFIYALIFTLTGILLWNKNELRIPAGLFITMAVCMVPLAIYGLEFYLNLWPAESKYEYPHFYQLVNGKWIFMELGTIIAGLVALYFFPFPFLTLPLLFASWFLTQDLIPLIFGKDFNWNQKSWVTLFFGLFLLLISFTLDKKKKQDYAFWSYLFGTIAFWAGLNSLVWNKNEFILIIYLFINLLMMFLSILIKRNVFMIFGALGVLIYLSHLAYDIFKDSVLFPFALSFIGLLILSFGIYYQKNQHKIEKKLISILPNRIYNFFNHSDMHY